MHIAKPCKQNSESKLAKKLVRVVPSATMTYIGGIQKGYPMVWVGRFTKIGYNGIWVGRLVR